MSKSFLAKIEENILKFLKPEFMTNQEKVVEFLDKKSNSGNKPVKSIFKSFEFNDMQVFRFGDKNAKNTILYIHGGAYVNEINWQHFIYCSLLARKLDAFVLAPVYPLAPANTALETFDLITSLYENIIENHEKIILMGDSAGGGFVLSFAQYLKTVNLPQPDNIIVFSPWVDISLSDSPYDDENDPILGEVGLREMGKAWAGSLDTRDYRVSPISGDNAGLAKTLIFSGTNEIFYKDIEKYVHQLKKENVEVRFIIGEGLFHIYPLFPMSEAKKAFNEIKKEII